MNTHQALTKLRKLLGPDAGLKDLKKPTSPALREQALAKRMEVKGRFDKVKAELEARKNALLAADEEYQRILNEWRAMRELSEKTSFGDTYRYTAGVVSSMFFHVEAQADTLEELIEKIEIKNGWK